MLSVIFPVLNEKNEIIEKTVQSIINTSPSDTEIIIVDDCSVTEPQFESKNKVIFHRNKIKFGAAQSKHFGVCFSTKPNIFLTDGHVLFDKNWYEETLKSLENKPNELFCGTCLGLSEDRFDLEQKKGAYCGARLFLHEENQILDGKWIGERPEDQYEISCVMGANYFMHRDWFFKIRGYSDLKGWGSEEPLLSMKTWLAGGRVSLNKKVITGHMFRNKAPYTTFLKEIVYNKIRMAKTFLPKDLCDLLISKLSKNAGFDEAQRTVTRDNSLIEEHKNYYKSIFINDIYWLCQKFNVNIPVQC